MDGAPVRLGPLLRYFLALGTLLVPSCSAAAGHRAFMRGGVESQFHGFTELQFLSSVAVAMITPGSVVITVAFVGCLVLRR